MLSVPPESQPSPVRRYWPAIVVLLATAAAVAAAGRQHTSPWLLLLLGGAASLLLAGLVLSATRTRDRAQAIARDMTAQLRARQRELEVQSELLDAVVQSVPMQITVKDAQHRLVLVNRGAEAFLDRPAGSLIGKTDFDIYPRERAEQVRAQDLQVLETGSLQDLESTTVDAQGQPHWVVKRKRTVSLPDGTRGVLTCIYDITQRKDAELQAEHSRAFLHAVVNATSQYVAVKDSESRFVVVNDAFARTFGHPREWIIGRNDFDLFAPDDAARYRAEDRSVLREGAALEIELPFAAADGEIRWFLKSKRRMLLPDGSAYVVISGTDITKRKRAEDALAASQARLQLLNRVASDIARNMALDLILQRSVLALGSRIPGVRIGFAAVGADSVATWQVCEGAAALPNLAGARLPLANAPEYLAALREGLTVVVQDAGTDLRVAGILQQLRETGTRAFIHAPVRAQQALAGLLTLETDLGAAWGADHIETAEALAEALGVALSNSRAESERRRAEQDLRATEAELREHRDNLQRLVDERTRELVLAKDAAEQANRAKSEFLANMSHELRTPLHAILSFARLGAQRAGAAGEGSRLSHYFARIDQSGERLLALLNDLLDLSRLEAARMHYEFGDHDLLPVLRTVVGEFESLARSAGLRLSLGGAEPGLRVRCDPMRIGQVLRNLIANATKFTPAGGAVEVSLDAGEAIGVDGAPLLARAALLRVQDSGVGIPEAELEAIFGKFIQSSRTRSSAGGTGLGLAICREIVRDHGGLLWARNGEGGGAVFTVALPLGGELCDSTPAATMSGPGAG